MTQRFVFLFFASLFLMTGCTQNADSSMVEEPAKTVPKPQTIPVPGCFCEMYNEQEVIKIPCGVQACLGGKVYTCDAKEHSLHSTKAKCGGSLYGEDKFWPGQCTGTKTYGYCDDDTCDYPGCDYETLVVGPIVEVYCTGQVWDCKDIPWSSSCDKVPGCTWLGPECDACQKDIERKPFDISPYPFTLGPRNEEIFNACMTHRRICADPTKDWSPDCNAAARAEKPSVAENYKCSSNQCKSAACWPKKTGLADDVCKHVIGQCGKCDTRLRDTINAEDGWLAEQGLADLRSCLLDSCFETISCLIAWRKAYWPSSLEGAVVLSP